MKFRIAFLVGGLVALIFSALLYANVIQSIWGVSTVGPFGTIWGIVFLEIWVILEALHYWVQTHRTDPRCYKCDHSLRGLKCPECGQELGEN